MPSMRVARGRHRIAENRRLVRGNVALGILQRGDRIPQVRASIETRPVVRRITGDQTIEVVGIALRLHQTLLSAFGAADVIRIVRPLAVERARDGLAVDRGRHVRSAVPEVGDEIRAAERPGRVERSRADVSGVGARRCVSACATQLPSRRS